MTDKSEQKQGVKRRQPQQERAMGKIQLILEAASRILDKDGVEALTTNRMAEVAGVSVGTIYQYFSDKASILDALAEQELGAMSAAVLEAMQGAAPATGGDRVRAVMRAVLNAYGGRTRVHRLLMQHMLMRGHGTPLPGMQAAIVEMMSGRGIAGGDQRNYSISEADAFVLTHAVAGVLRAMTAVAKPPPAAQVEDALVRLVMTYFGKTPPA